MRRTLGGLPARHRAGLLALAAILSGMLASRVSSAASSLPAAEAEIRAVLDEQAAAWNRGDIEGFMRGYWKSERTTFSGSSGTTRGWQGLLERYRRSYPDRKTMGRLTFAEIEITMLSRDAALVLGHWKLEREADQPGGVFTLIARRMPEGWRIIHDHTSSVAAPKP